jgi:hypothetical protein
MGCQTTGTYSAKNDWAIARIKIGSSTPENVRRLLGQPTTVYQNLLVEGETRDVWRYEYSRSEINPLSLVPIVNFYSSPGPIEQASVNVFFDSTGLVSDVRMSRYKAP